MTIEGVPVVYWLDCSIVVREFELESRYYIHLRTDILWNGMNSLISQLWIEIFLMYPVKTISYADDIALLANAPAQDETLLHSLERAATDIGSHVNAHKMEYMSTFPHKTVPLCFQSRWTC